MTLPSIDFFRDGIIGTTVATVRCNIPTRIRGQRSTVGPVLQLPLEAVHERSAKIMMLYGVLKLAGENEGITIPAQSFVINDTQLRIPMTDEELARIETHRAGKEIAGPQPHYRAAPPTPLVIAWAYFRTRLVPAI